MKTKKRKLGKKRSEKKPFTNPDTPFFGSPELMSKDSPQISNPPQLVEEKKKQLRRWVVAFSRSKAGLTLSEEDTNWLDKVSVSDLKEKILWPDIVKIMLEEAYTGLLTDPYLICEAINYENVLIYEVAEYFNTDPSRWSIAFLELIAHCHEWPIDQFNWRNEKLIIRFKFDLFLRSGVLPTGHSNELYHFLYTFFFGYEGASDLLHHGDYDEEQSPKIMRSVIEQGKNGIFPWVFETYLTD